MAHAYFKSEGFGSPRCIPTEQPWGGGLAAIEAAGSCWQRALKSWESLRVADLSWEQNLQCSRPVRGQGSESKAELRAQSGPMTHVRGAEGGAWGQLRSEGKVGAGGRGGETRCGGHSLCETILQFSSSYLLELTRCMGRPVSLRMSRYCLGAEALGLGTWKRRQDRRQGTRDRDMSSWARHQVHACCF